MCNEIVTEKTPEMLCAFDLLLTPELYCFTGLPVTLPSLRLSSHFFSLASHQNTMRRRGKNLTASPENATLPEPAQR